MAKVLWLTDLHLDHLTESERVAFIDDIATQEADAVLLGGDIGLSGSVVKYLGQLVAELRKPIYFVLGNHDYYHGSIRDVRERVKALTEHSPNLVWLSSAGVVRLTPDVGLVGHGAWADGRLGDYSNSRVRLNDYLLIKELANLSSLERLHTMQQLADEAAAHFRRVLPGALSEFEHVYVLTHVPPFREACWHEGRNCDDDYLPHFGNKCVGEVLVEAISTHSEKRLTVLCGHTHGGGLARILPNLDVETGEANYGEPTVQSVFTL